MLTEIIDTVQSGRAPMVPVGPAAADTPAASAYDRPRMADVALYYPYVHPRDDGWLKHAVLYWPTISNTSSPAAGWNGEPTASPVRR